MSGDGERRGLLRGDAVAVASSTSSGGDASGAAAVRMRLSVAQKLAYGVGSIPYGLIATIKGFFLNAFLLEVAGLDAMYAGTLLLATKFVDGISDPIVGRLSDRTNSRFGRRRVWVLGGALPLAACYVALWMVMPDSFSQGARLGYYLAAVLLLDVTMTAVYIPLHALAAEATEEYDERTSLVMYQSICHVIGSLVPPFIHSELLNAFWQPLIHPPIPNFPLGYGVSALVMAGIILLCLIVFLIGTRRFHSISDAAPYPFFASLKTALKYKPFVCCMLMYLFSSLSVMMVQNNVLLFITTVVDLEPYFSYLLLLMNLSTMLFVVIWSRVARRIGKRAVFLIGAMALSVLVMSLVWLPAGDPATLPVAFVVAGLAGSGVSIMYLVPYSMLPDVIDVFEAEHSARYDGLFYSLFVFMQKFGVALTLSMSNFVLEGCGYVPGSGGIVPQPPLVLLALRLLTGPVPVFFMLVSLIPAFFYRIDRSTHQLAKLAVSTRALAEGTRTSLRAAA